MTLNDILTGISVAEQAYALVDQLIQSGKSVLSADDLAQAETALAASIDKRHAQQKETVAALEKAKLQK